ncbi:MAG TPA: hypothetical protein PLG90_06855 [Ignavibacteria bacterium]|nr:hypothetical protein [Ignavibacteria bacterium]
MKKIKLLLSLVLLLCVTSASYSQNDKLNLSDFNKSDSYNKKQDLNSFVNPVITPTGRVGMGVNAGFANIENGTGFAIGLFAEIKTEQFSFVPQANYWKVNKLNNFELAGLIRARFASTSIEPYVDGGIGINFLTQEDNNSVTKLGIDVGGGIELLNIAKGYTLIFDGKYKIIIQDKNNIDGFVVTAGIKFPLQ